MNKLTYITLTIVSLTGYKSAYSIENASTISWREPHFPPYVITNGNMENHGIDDLIKEDAALFLTDFKHVFQESNYARALSDIESKKSVLITPLFKTPEREKYVHYSAIASYLVLPNGFIINRADKARFEPYLKHNGELDIEELINSEKLSVGVNLGRSYSGILDEMIRKYPNTFHTKGGNGSDWTEHQNVKS